jgi:hypothetical protein
MKGEYIENKSHEKNSNFFVQNQMSNRACPINIVLIGHYNQTIEPSNKSQARHVWPR